MAIPPPGPGATFEHLCYWYPPASRSAGSDPRTAALFDINLELGPGLTLVGGDSGAGKSTLLRVLNGLVPHYHGGRIAGGATTAGLNVLSTPTRVLARHVGFVFQESEVGFVRSTVAREVAFGPENLGFAPRVVERQVGEALERVGIAGLASRRLSTLSGGERQRVALAGALAAAPEMIVLDEPTSQLDEAGVATLASILNELARAGHAVVVAEHHAGRFSGAATVVVAGGRLAQARPPGPSGGTWATARDVQVGEAADGASRAAAGEAPRKAGAATGRVGDSWVLSGVTAGIDHRPVVSGIELSGAPGEIVVLNGPNGSGKTTVLRTIAGLLPPLAGQVTRPLSAPKAGRPVGYLPQDPGTLLHRRSVLAEVQQTLRWSRTSEDPTLILRQLGLGRLAGADPRDLSTGQRQRAALAAVLAGRPSLVLLDEPTRGMDGESRSALAATLRSLAEDGASVVVATHDAELAQQLGNRVILVEGGCAKPKEPDDVVVR